MMSNEQGIYRLLREKLDAWSPIPTSLKTPATTISIFIVFALRAGIFPYVERYALEFPVAVEDR